MSDGKTLCIPTVFCAYSGEALDYKIPLLQSKCCLEPAAIPLGKIFDGINWATLGFVSHLVGEQEYFLVDLTLYYCASRPPWYGPYITW